MRTRKISVVMVVVFQPCGKLGLSCELSLVMHGMLCMEGSRGSWRAVWGRK